MFPIQRKEDISYSRLTHQPSKARIADHAAYTSDSSYDQPDINANQVDGLAYSEPGILRRRLSYFERAILSARDRDHSASSAPPMAPKSTAIQQPVDDPINEESVSLALLDKMKTAREDK